MKEKVPKRSTKIATAFSKPRNDTDNKQKQRSPRSVVFSCPLYFLGKVCYTKEKGEVMPTITRISEQAKDKKRCNLYLDGAFYCGLTLESVMRERLKVGMQIEPAELDKIQEDSEKETALEKAYSHLSHSMKTEKDMRSFLKKKGYVDSVIEYVMEKLQTYGFVDDSEYATRYTSSQSKGKGKRLIAMELKAKGVGEEEIESALDTVQDETSSARLVYEKYMRGKVHDKETEYKAMRYLIGKGFDYDTAKEVISFHEDDDT